jgi:hypothetical protein
LAPPNSDQRNAINQTVFCYIAALIEDPEVAFWPETYGDSSLVRLSLQGLFKVDIADERLARGTYLGGTLRGLNGLSHADSVLRSKARHAS